MANLWMHTAKVTRLMSCGNELRSPYLHGKPEGVVIAIGIL